MLPAHETLAADELSRCAEIATKLGLVALSIEEFRDDLSVGSINYPPLPIAEGSILSFQLKNLGDADALVFDSDGDGMPELTLSSRTAADPTTYAQLIIDVVRTVPLPVGIRQSLLAKVDAVFKSLQAGNPISAGGELNAYLNELRALRGNQIPSDTAEALTAFGTILRSLMP